MTAPREHVEEISCQEFVELVTDYFEGALGPRTQNRVEEHLVMCHYCETYAEQIRATMRALRALDDEPPAGEPSPAILAALRRRREDSR
ncbi:MAG: zf-HC2 domain-containing protein [Solirubrobacterales bacterium]|nr:zf-HC2 domain-containing protein [Solirubrobacterales bacterium]